MAKNERASTKENLLAAASEVFVEKGYRDATVAEICKRAGANVAAVNYHFGSKEALYQEAWRFSFAESMVAHPQDGGVPANAPAEERLRGQLRALIERITDAGNIDFQISQRELVSPTGLLEEVMQREIIPLREKTLAVVRELLGPDVSEQQVVFCETSIISLCIHPIVMQQHRGRSDEATIPPAIDNVEAFKDHVVSFALAGLHAVKVQ